MMETYITLRLSLEEVQWLRKAMLLMSGDIEPYDDSMRRAILVKLREPGGFGGGPGVVEGC